MTEDPHAHLRERGLRRIREVTCVDENAPVPAFEPRSVEDHAVTVVFGDLWCGEELSDRDRRLITLGVLGALGAERELPWHIKGALDSGDLTPEQLRETVLQIAHYAGVPRGTSMSAIIRETTGSAGSTEKTEKEA